MDHRKSIAIALALAAATLSAAPASAMTLSLPSTLDNELLMENAGVVAPLAISTARPWTDEPGDDDSGHDWTGGGADRSHDWDHGHDGDRDGDGHHWPGGGGDGGTPQTVPLPDALPLLLSGLGSLLLVGRRQRKG